MYNCIGINILGSSMVVLLVVGPGVSTSFKERTTVGLSPRGISVASMSKYNDVRGRV